MRAAPALLLLLVGCSARVPLHAPWSLLGDTLYVELTDAWAEDDTLQVSGPITNTSDEHVRLLLDRWRVRLDDGTLLEPTFDTLHDRVRPLAARDVTSVRVDFDLDGHDLGDGASLLIAASAGHHAEVLGEIPLSVEPLPPGVAGAPPPKRARRQEDRSRDDDMLRRACGSGPLITCPR
jgi:hypothetical protein